MKNTILLSCLLFCSCFAYSQNVPAYSALTIPDSLKENAHDVVRLEHQVFKVDSPGSATFKVKRVVTILDKKSNYKNLVINYSPDRKLGKITASIYDLTGKKVKDISKKEIRDYSSVSDFSIYEDDRVKHIAFHHPHYPFTIAYEYDITYDGLSYYPSWDIQDDYGVAVEKSHFEIHLPPSVAINYRNFNTTLEPVISNNPSKHYSWEATNLKAITAEEESPRSVEVLPWVAVTPTFFEIAKHRGNMKDWQSFGKFMHELNKGRDQLSPKMIAKVKSLTANATTDREKIEILYSYLQKNTRYVSVQLGIGGWQTFDAEYVENNKYGDCKALTNFMKSMLLASNITAYPALISTTDFPIPEDFAVPYFNHVILNIPSEDMWLECTSNHFPPNYLGEGSSDKNVLRITENGGELVRTPKYTAQDNNSICKASIAIETDGSATINQSTTFSGAYHEYYRYAANSLSEEEQKKSFYNYSSLPSFDIQSLQITADASEPTAEVVCGLKVGKYVSHAGKRLFIPLNSLNPFSEIPKSVKNRKYPVSIDLAYSEEDHFTFRLPENYTLESYPQDAIVLESKFGKYTVEIELEEDQLIYHRSLTIESGRFAPSEYSDLRAFYKEIAKKDGMKLVLTKKPIRP